MKFLATPLLDIRPTPWWSAERRNTVNQYSTAILSTNAARLCTAKNVRIPTGILWRMSACASLFRRFTHANVYGTGSVKIRKTRHNISVDARIFFTVQSCVMGELVRQLASRRLLRIDNDSQKIQLDLSDFAGLWSFADWLAACQSACPYERGSVLGQLTARSRLGLWWCTARHRDAP